MARKHDDAAVARAPLAEDQVADYLRRHPDFLIRNPDLALILSPPSRFDGEDGVLDLQVYMIERLRDEMDDVRGAAEHLITTSRSNMSTQNRTHRAVLQLMAADSLEALAQAVTDDLPTLLDVDVATLRFEEADRPLPVLALPTIRRVTPGSVVKVLGGPDRDCALADDLPGDPALFGEAADLVRSAAMVRLTPGGACPDGLLCLGSRHGRTFHAGQATDLLNFLGRVTELCVRRFVG
ncbi:MAG: DUF484 family protein [Pseudomonadota bacterium]